MESTGMDEWQTNKSVPEANSYMLKYEVACDITFIVGDAKEEIRAHKYMMMSRSPILFKSLVKHLGNTDVRISVPDMKPHIFRDMLQYVYTDEFDIHTDNVTSMLYAAKKFQLKGLTTICFQYLDAEMHDETVAKIMEQAHIYNETGLFEKCVRYILTNGASVLKKPTFGDLCEDCISRIIRSDDLRANEEAVFEGAVTWANAECRRQKKQPTDQNRRQVLGKLLYYIRFPIMDVTYFTQKVSLGSLLSHDENLSIFQYFHGEEQQLPNRFSRSERHRVPRNLSENIEPVMLTSRSPSHGRVHRFALTDGQWKQNGPPDAISFTVSSPIVLYGAEVYGVAAGKETYSLKIFVYDDITREEIRKNDSSLFTNSIKQTYDVYLTRPLRIPARRVFTVMVLMKGNPTHKGVDGEKVHIVDGVQFEFTDSNRSSNGTDCNVGQIAGLLFNKTQ
ncbi:BTB/POZ domain-containing protein 3 [Mactra antiquata]